MGGRDNYLEFREEGLNFSMRWLNGNFDDWSNLKQWQKEAESQAYDHKGFHKMRTTYFDVDEREDNLGGRVDESMINRWVAILGNRNVVLPSNLTIEDFTRMHPSFTVEKAARAFGKMGVYKKEVTIPTAGYVPVLEVLSQYGDVSAKDARGIPKMTPEQGLVYLTDKVIPAVVEFARVR